jgi:2-oxoglutarate dehydrogenase E2 component (dihydrolipoamide succinyltransferase)
MRLDCLHFELLLNRLVDGRESVSFLVRIKQYLEDPARLMLEI